MIESFHQMNMQEEDVYENLMHSSSSKLSDETVKTDQAEKENDDSSTISDVIIKVEKDKSFPCKEILITTMCDEDVEDWVDKFGLKGPLFICCENCHHWNFLDPDMTALEAGRITDDNVREMKNSNDNDVSIASDDTVDNISHNFTASEEDGSSGKLDVMVCSSAFEIWTVVKRPKFRWRGQLCNINQPASVKNGMPWDESMDLCRECRMYITGCEDDSDIFPEKRWKTQWINGNRAYEEWKENNLRQWKDTNTNQFYWPSYFYLLLCDDRVLDIDAKLLWTMLLMVMRCWWHETIIRRKGWIYCPVAKTKTARNDMQRFRKEFFP